MPLEEILDYARMLKRRLWLIVLLTLATVGTIFFQQYTAQPRYEASVRFQITDPPRGAVSLFDSFRAPAVREEIPFIRENFHNVLTSRSVAGQVIVDLGLQDMGVENFIGAIQVEDVADSDFTQVKMTANDPQLVADMLNALMREALRQYGQLRAGSVTLSKEFITTELEASRQELQKAQEALIAFKVENRVGSLNGMVNQQQELLRTLRLWRDEAWARGSPEQVEKFDQALIQREAELQDLVRLSAQYEALEADVQQAQQAFYLLRDKQMEAKLIENEARAVGFIQVLGEAKPPLRAAAPFSLKLLALGGAVSLGVGVALAFLLEFLSLAAAHQEPEAGQDKRGVEGVAEA